MDLERAFTFIWQDEEWPAKIAIAAVLTLTGIGTIPVLGWAAETARRIANEEDQPLPPWDQIGEYTLTGLKYIGITFIWLLPVTLLVILMSASFLIPATADNPGPWIAAASILSMCFLTFAAVYSIAAGLLAPVLLVPLAEGQGFGKLLNPKHAWKIFRGNAGGFVVTILITWIASSILGFVGSLLCLIGVFPATVIGQLVMAHLLGQATAQSQEGLNDLGAAVL
jgi:hypothetical protein